MTAEASRRPFVLFVSYHPPEELPPGRRLQTLRNELDAMGVATSVLTTAAFGRGEGDVEEGIVRTFDLRPRRRSTTPPPGTRRPIRDLRRHPLSRLLVPDITSFSWLPAASLQALRAVRRRCPDVVFTTSPPESPHLLGLLLRRLGIPWVADLRDGWTFEPPVLRPYATRLDRGLERATLARADALTAASPRLVEDLSRRFSKRVVLLPNAADPTRLASATDERDTLDAGRFSLVYTGTGGVDGKDPRPFLRALTNVLDRSPRLRERLEVVFAGNFTAAEAAAMKSPKLERVVRWLGPVTHHRAVGLQRAADGLLLLATPGATSVTTGKLYEYLAVAKPILAYAAGTDAEVLLRAAGGHVVASATGQEEIERGLKAFLEQWLEPNGRPLSALSLDEVSVGPVAERLAALLGEVGGFEVNR